MEDEYNLLLTCSTYNEICEKYDDLLDGHDNLSTHISTNNNEHYMYALFSHKFLLQSSKTPYWEVITYKMM